MSLTIKNHLYQKCINLTEQRLERLRKQVVDIKINLESETKSSVGDKFETGRAMLQLEREKLSRQIVKVNRLQQSLYNIEINREHFKASLGCLVITSKANYFISISLGALEYNGIKYYAISPKTPIGKLLLGKQDGDSFIFNNDLYKITKVY